MTVASYGAVLPCGYKHQVAQPRTSKQTRKEVTASTSSKCHKALRLDAGLDARHGLVVSRALTCTSWQRTPAYDVVIAANSASAVTRPLGSTTGGQTWL